MPQGPTVTHPKRWLSRVSITAEVSRSDLHVHPVHSVKGFSLKSRVSALVQYIVLFMNKLSWTFRLFFASDFCRCLTTCVLPVESLCWLCFSWQVWHCEMYSVFNRPLKMRAHYSSVQQHEHQVGLSYLVSGWCKCPCCRNVDRV